MSEVNLNSHDTHPIMRIGNAVHRPTEWWTPAVHALLGYLESTGFTYSPRVLGFDDEGREVLSYIEGESGREGWRKITTDEGLRKFAKLLRAYHDAVADFKPGGGAQWARGKETLKRGQIVCHGDFGPWNIVWQEDEPVGIIDWDLALPANPEYDILYALEYSAPFRDDSTTLEWHHFPEVPDRRHRIQVFLDAYGRRAIDNVAQRVAQMQRHVGKYEAYLAKRGVQPQVDWIAGGDLEKVEARARWTEANKHLFE